MKIHIDFANFLAVTWVLLTCQGAWSCVLV